MYIVKYVLFCLLGLFFELFYSAFPFGKDTGVIDYRKNHFLQNKNIFVCFILFIVIYSCKFNMYMMKNKNFTKIPIKSTFYNSENFKITIKS